MRFPNSSSTYIYLSISLPASLSPYLCIIRHVDSSAPKIFTIFALLLITLDIYSIYIHLGHSKVEEIPRKIDLSFFFFLFSFGFYLFYLYFLSHFFLITVGQFQLVQNRAELTSYLSLFFFPSRFHISPCHASYEFPVIMWLARVLV